MENVSGVNSIFTLLAGNAFAIVTGCAILLFSIGIEWILLWAIFAGTICVLIARYKGLNMIVYGVVGAIYSVLFILPWIYLILRMYGVHIRRGIILCVYGVIYIYVWMFGAVAFSLIAAIELFPSISTLILMLNLLIGLTSLKMIWNRDSRDRKDNAYLVMKHSEKYVDEMWAKGLPKFSYMVPFILIPIWSLISLSSLLLEPWDVG